MNNSFIKIIAGIIGAVVAYAVVSHLQFGSGAHFDKALFNTANELNKNLPMMGDRDTRWDSTGAEPGNKFIYIYTLVNHTKDEMDVPTLEKALRPKIIAGYKTSDQMKSFREHNVELHYQYKDKTGEFVFEIVVSPKDF
jgi:hypothetical protein